MASSQMTYVRFRTRSAWSTSVSSLNQMERLVCQRENHGIQEVGAPKYEGKLWRSQTTVGSFDTALLHQSRHTAASGYKLPAREPASHGWRRFAALSLSVMSRVNEKVGTLEHFIKQLTRSIYLQVLLYLSESLVHTCAL